MLARSPAKPTWVLLLSLKDELCGPDPTLSDELTSILNELTQLSRSEHCKVALRARQVGLNVCCYVCACMHVRVLLCVCAHV